MIHTLTDADFDQKLADIKSKIAVFYLTASWCAPCRALAPIIKTISEEYSDVEFLKVDIDENTQIPEHFSVQAVPTLVFVKNGEIKDRIIGLKNKAGLAEVLDKLLVDDDKVQA